MRVAAATTVAALLAALTPATPAQARTAQCPALPQPAAARSAVPFESLLYGVPTLGSLATGAGVRVAVLDSGVDPTHPQMRGAVAAGRDFLRDGDGRQDCVGHGTGVASVIAARPRDTTGFRGLAPGVTVVPVRVSEQERIGGETAGANGSPADFARAITWAADPAGGNAQVLNLSLVMTVDDPAVRRAVAAAVASGVVVVAAVGNAGGADEANPTPYPAAYPAVIGVGATMPDGTRAAFSQRGPYVDLVAPGAGVTVAAPESGHRTVEGTSYAAPFVAASAALILERFPHSSPQQVARRLFATADPAPGGGRSDAYGYGMVNPYRAVAESLAPAGARPHTPHETKTLDPAAAAAQQRRDRAQHRALAAAAAGAGLVIAVLLAASVWRRGRQRRWRPANPTR